RIANAFFFQAEDGIRDKLVTGVQTCALPIWHWPLPPLVSAVVLPIKSTRLICTRSSCIRNAINGASAMRPLPNRSRKPVLFLRELLQSLGNGHANEREYRSEQRKIDNR